MGTLGVGPRISIGGGGGGIIPGREAFVTFGTSANVAWNKLDKFGTLITLANANISVWQDKEAGEVSIEFTYTVVVERLTSSNDFWLGFDESAAPTNATTNFTGFYYSATNSLKFMENGVDMGVIDNPSIQNWAIYKCTRSITDGIFRAYRDDTLIYTSSHTSIGEVFPWVKSAGANNKPISNIYVTS